MALMSTNEFEHEISIYIATVSTSIIFGIYLGLIFLVVGMILSNGELSMPRSARILYLSFEGLLFLLNSVAFMCILLMGDMVWIVHRDNPVPYYQKNGTGDPWYLYLSILVQALSMFLGDALLIYRCHKIFGSRPWVVAIPAMCSVGYLGRSWWHLFESCCALIKSLLERSFTVFSILDYALPQNKLNASFFAQILMLIVNPVVTAMICSKIFSVSRGIRQFSYVSKPYTNISAILIESAAPWTVLGILLAITVWIEDVYWWEGLYIMWCAVGLLSPQLVIIRVVMGVAWDKRVSIELTQLSTMTFSPAPHAVRHNTQCSGTSAKSKPTALDKNNSFTNVISNYRNEKSLC